MALPFTGPKVTFNIIQGVEFVWGGLYGTTTNVVTPIVVTPFDFTGYRAKSQIRTQPGGPLLLDISAYFTLNTGGVQGRIDIVIPASDTATLVEGGTYDLLAIPTPDTGTLMILQGAVNLTKSNTE